jgi:predicted nucleic acid-binding protein
MRKPDSPLGRFVLDTNIWVDAFRDADAERRLYAFKHAHAPGEYLSSVVAAEILAGLRSAGERRRFHRFVLSAFDRMRRVVTPSDAAWRRAGETIAAARRKYGSVPATRAFGNDVLIALSCREAGMTLVTDDRRDFGRIAALAPFDYVVGLPGPA